MAWLRGTRKSWLFLAVFDRNFFLAVISNFRREFSV